MKGFNSYSELLNAFQPIRQFRIRALFRHNQTSRPGAPNQNPEKALLQNIRDQSADHDAHIFQKASGFELEFKKGTRTGTS